MQSKFRLTYINKGVGGGYDKRCRILKQCNVFKNGNRMSGTLCTARHLLCPTIWGGTGTVRLSFLTFC